MSVRRRGVVVPARLTLAGLGVAAAAGGLAIAEGPGRATTYAGASTAGAVLTLAAGLGLVLAGIVTALDGRGYAGDLALAAGVTWFAPLWIAWGGGSPVVRSLAMGVAVLSFPLLLHLILAWPEGRLASSRARALTATVYGEAIGAAVLLALFRNPYLDPSCWANCNVNSFLATSLPSFSNAVEIADRWFVLTASVVLGLHCLARLARGSRIARARLAPVLLPAAVFAGAIVAHAIALQRTPVENPFNLTLRGTYLAMASAVTLLGVGLVLAVGQRHAGRRALQGVLTTLGDTPSPGSVEAALAHALGDEELEITYPWRDGRWVDARGLPTPEPSPTPDRVLSRLRRHERVIAVVAHKGALPDLERHLTPSLLLGLENERLQAGVLAELAELRTSRARIVETADDERRQLERNLHDGAQQRILALSYDLRLAVAAAQADGDESTGTALVDAIEQTQVALDELRELAHGIYPAVLAEAGLGPALATLADTAPLPVTTTADEGIRYAAPVENTTFFAAVEALADATERHATRIDVRLESHDSQLVLIVDDDGLERAGELTRLADRVGALGGTVVLGSRSLRTEIPCE